MSHKYRWDIKRDYKDEGYKVIFKDHFESLLLNQQSMVVSLLLCGHDYPFFLRLTNGETIYQHKVITQKKYLEERKKNSTRMVLIEKYIICQKSKEHQD